MKKRLTSVSNKKKWRSVELQIQTKIGESKKATELLNDIQLKLNSERSG